MSGLGPHMEPFACMGIGIPNSLFLILGCLIVLSVVNLLPSILGAPNCRAITRERGQPVAKYKNVLLKKLQILEFRSSGPLMD